MPTILKTLIGFISRKEVYGVIVTCAIAYFSYKTCFDSEYNYVNLKKHV
jgi:hypothetical protein